MISLTKQRKYTIPSKFPVFRGEVQKVFWNTTLFCRQWLRLLSAWTFKSFFQKQQSVGNTNVFLWTSSQKLVANMIAAWKKKVARCDRRVKHFPFLQERTLLGTSYAWHLIATTRFKKHFICHEYIKNCVKNLFEVSVTFREPKGFITSHNVYTCFYNIKIYSSKNYVSFVGQD